MNLAPEIKVKEGDMVLVCETSSSRHREGAGLKLVHEKLTSPWPVRVITRPGIILEVTMEGHIRRSKEVSTAAIKASHKRPRHLRQPIEDEFVRLTWDAGNRALRATRLRAPSNGTWANPLRAFRLVSISYCVILNRIDNQGPSRKRC